NFNRKLISLNNKSNTTCDRRSCFNCRKGFKKERRNHELKHKSNPIRDIVLFTFKFSSSLHNNCTFSKSISRSFSSSCFLRSSFRRSKVANPLEVGGGAAI